MCLIEICFFEVLGDNSYLMLEDGYNGKDIIEIGKDLVEKYFEIKDYFEEVCLKEFRKLGVEYEMVKLKNDLVEFNMYFDNWFSEIFLYEKGEIFEVLVKMKELGYMYEVDGVVWLCIIDFKDDKDRVLIKNDGIYMYFLLDIVYYFDKVKCGNDILIDLFGVDYYGYINCLKVFFEMFGVDSNCLEI